MKGAVRISDFDDIDEIEHEALLTGSPERSWIWFGLIISLCLHITLCIYFYRARFQSAETVFADLQQPMTFRVKNRLSRLKSCPIKVNTKRDVEAERYD